MFSAVSLTQHFETQVGGHARPLTHCSLFASKWPDSYRESWSRGPTRAYQPWKEHRDHSALTWAQSLRFTGVESEMDHGER